MNQPTAAGQLQGRVALVTGASNGIGRAIARRFSDEGATVIGLDLLEPDADAGLAEHVQGDVGDEATLQRVIAAAVATHGRLDVLVNNAALQIEGGFDDITDDALDKMLRVNVRGVFNACRIAAAAMTPAGGGAIINLASMLSFTADPVLAGYCATKGAVVQVTRSAAVAYGPRGIRVNAICPGSVLTPLTTRIWDLAEDPAGARAQMESLYPLRRIVMPEEVAGPALFLAGDDASAITGATLNVDCGITATNAEYVLTATLA
jgi:NAD(P)-dependent dehydrogenase (short-subunit alcohol dehydrogenase family)